MPSARPKHPQFIQALNHEGRQYSTAVVVFHHAVSRRLGLNAGDHKYADILMRAGPMTAGKLAEITGLTTGAITGVVDRLARAGWVQRKPDPSDKRRVILVPVNNPKKARAVQEIFGSLGAAMAKLSGSYTQKELALIHEYMRRSRTILLTEAVKLGGNRPAKTAS